MIISSASKEKPFESRKRARVQGQADNRGVNYSAITQEEIDELESRVLRHVCVWRRRRRTTRRGKKRRGKRRRRATMVSSV
jgi:hypothetical protein